MRKKTGLTLGICAGVLAIVAVVVGTGVVVKMFGEKDEAREETYVPEEMESQPEQQDTEASKAEPLSYTSVMIQAGDYVTVEYPVFSGGEYQEAVQRLNERVKSEAERIALEQETEMNSFLAEAEEMDMDISVSFERSLKNVYIEGSMIYVEQFDYSYTGGAHGLSRNCTPLISFCR